MKKAFKALTEIQLEQLSNMKIDKHFISAADIEKVTDILDLDNLNTEEDLRAVRNSVVRYFMDESDTSSDYDLYSQRQTTMSGIVAVIDSKLFEKGYLY